MEPSVTEKIFYGEIQKNSKLVQMYENQNLLKYAADLLPFENLHVRATLKLSELESKEVDASFEDLLLIELLHWFKFSFFTWVDVPKCDTCEGVPENRGNVPPSESELVWGAHRVEHFFCLQCQQYIRFPRYNHPKKLLETRKGRCGEWANCFTFLCRALGYDARFVVDWNDHVWTEVFSVSKDRWLHCDPCENICDQPLLYEIGWKKQITYVIAFSKDEVQDVTWRYTSKFVDVLNRRKLCREKWLLNCILSFIHRLQIDVSPERKRELIRRRGLELAEFLSPPKCDSGSLGGRTSGSIDWRISRGETDLLSDCNSYIFELYPQEIEKKQFHLKYSCAFDKYIRISNNSSENECWTSCAFSHTNIFRKVENDWKVTYLARTEGSSKSTIMWKFNFRESGLVIKSLKLNLQSTTFDSGTVRWFLFPESEQSVPKIYAQGEVMPLLTQDFSGCSGFVISAELTGGSGIAAWQHSQLFRQPVGSAEFPFEVEISFMKL